MYEVEFSGGTTVEDVSECSLLRAGVGTGNHLVFIYLALGTVML